MSSVHPHACGEHHHTRIRMSTKSGSSPRMWGTPLHKDCLNLFGRSIPTHVGNTRWFPPRIIRHPVHPHACGEHCKPRRTYYRKPGSSPRMWGTRGYNLLISRRIRFIPTHVGNTMLQDRHLLYPAVHPHACGEHCIPQESLKGTAGSSPRMWGTPISHQWPSAISRFIPTHVGNTGIHTPPPTTMPVHPHACGEH